MLRTRALQLFGAGLFLVIGLSLTPAIAHAEPKTQTPDTHTPDTHAPDSKTPKSLNLLELEEAVPGPPMTVPAGNFGYVATRGVTLQMAAQRPADFIRGLPVPPEYRPANDALAAHTKREFDAAVKTPGACIQLIVGPGPNGNLFQYGVWSVSREYCPV